jgi:murein DD-endopeptidase MepM/ murein hydrolase activator NlpD
MKQSFFALVMLALAAGLAWADYPQIKKLDSSDVVFLQLQADLAAAYQAENSAASGAQGASDADLVIYRFVMEYEADLLTLAARLNIPYETLATLNRLPSARGIPAGREILIPSRPGIFLPDKPDSDLEFVMMAGRKDIEGASFPIKVKRQGRLEVFHFFPRSRFTGSERVFFLLNLFRYPLPKGTLTSGFGTRASPFTGKLEFHDGIDLAAPLGTDVYAARKGKVIERGYSDTLGNYVILDHGDGYSTVYGHMQKILVALNETVKSGSILGIVGSTGRSTGPHLHFEVRLHGKAQNPESFIRSP